MSATVVSLCASCPASSPGLVPRLAAALAAEGLDCRVRQADCLSGCTRPATLAFRAPGKTAYLFGDISADDLAEILIFARLYLAAPDGNLADARPLGRLRHKVIARIPG